MSEGVQHSPFYDDFRAESDELLSHIRRILGSFRNARGVGQRDLVSALLRQFHTLKGLTGMVGLKRAGHLTHLMESYLLSQQGQSGALSEETVMRIAAATRDLETLISTPDSSSSDVLDRYQKLFDEAGAQESTAVPEGENSPAEDWLELLPEDIASALSPSDRQLVAEGLHGGSGLTLITFASSPERAERGIKVNDIREALGARGDLVRVIPQISGRDVRFVFVLLVSVEFDPAELEVEREDIVAARPPSHLHPARNEDAGANVPSTLRVGTERLEEVMRLVEGLVVSRYRLDQRIEESNLVPDVKASLKETAQQMQRQMRDLTEAVMRVRMVPLSDILQRMPLLTEELAHESGKSVELVLRGEETRVDKNVVERLLDPLLHLVRNAVAHGIELPPERRRLAKPDSGRVTIEAKPDGNSILITVSDDGGGLAPEPIFARARALGLLFREEDSGALLEVLCSPGFSTREQAGLDAGRGVGMDIVRGSVESVGGSLRMSTEPGLGTTFFLRIPLTTAIVDALLVEAAGSTFAIPTQELQEIVEVDEHGRVKLQTSELLRHRGLSLRLYQLPKLLSLAESPSTYEGRLALIYGSGAAAAAFGVDKVTGLREVVVRSFSDPLVVRPWFLGATELGDGRLVLILHLPELLRRAAA